MTDIEKKIKSTILELSALNDTMNRNQCYACSYEFIDVVERFGTDILDDVISFLRDLDAKITQAKMEMD